MRRRALVHTGLTEAGLTGRGNRMVSRRVLCRAGIAAMVVVMMTVAWLGAQGRQPPAEKPASQAPQQQATPPPALPTSLADLKPVESDDRMLKAPPSITVKPDGTAEVSFETAVATPAGRLYVGTLIPSAAIDTPFFPLSVREAIKEPATAHRVTIDVRRLDSWLPPAGTDGVREGDAYVRFELYDSGTAAARYFETRVHYASLKGQYERRTTVLLGPVIDQVTPTSALVSWNTDAPAPGVVELWTGDAARKLGEFRTSAPADHPVVKIDGLKPGGRYKYRVLVSDPADGRVVNTGRLYPFKAAPAPAGSFKFVYMSDGRPASGGGFVNFNGVNAAVTPRLLGDGYRRGGEFALFGGDLTGGYTSSADNFRMMLDTWKHVTDPVAHEMPIYEGFGNHESLHNFYVDAQGNRYSTDRLGEVSSEGEFAARFVNPGNAPEPETRDGVVGPPYKGTVYSFDYGNSHFVMLNLDYWFTTGGPPGDRSLAWKLLGGNRAGYIMANQLAWLDRDLAAARKRGVVHIFIAGHEPVAPVAGHVGGSMWWRGLDDATLPSGDVLTMRTKFLGVADRYGVAAMMFGHEHVYARLDIDKTVDKQLTRPIVQFISGGAGAPFYAQDGSAPWTNAVKKFASINHYLLFSVSAAGVTFEAIDLDGRVFDSGVIR